MRASLRTAPAYSAFLRARLRMLLEALEDDLRGDYGEGQPAPRGMTVEHILPQSWVGTWPLPGLDPAEAAGRDRLVHRLGNLTLVSGKLNPALSNRAWVKEGEPGKRDYLLEHSNLKLNAAVVSAHPLAWTESDIRARTEQLTERLLSFWARPPATAPTLVDEASRESEASTFLPVERDEVAGEESHTGKYRELWRWLRQQTSDRVELTFAQVEQILGFALPASCRLHLAHWYGFDGSAVARAIYDAGWKSTDVSLGQETVVFVPR